MSAARSPRKSEYYLWDETQLWRIPPKLHAELVAGAVALPQYAGTRQKILEIVHPERPALRPKINARGHIYAFDAAGTMDLSFQAEAIAGAVMRDKTATNVRDISGLLRRRRWQREGTWDTSTMLRKLARDLESGRLSVVPDLRPVHKQPKRKN